MPYIGPAPEPNPDGIKDLNGGKLVLDADADTSITSDTDDQIDVEISGADDFRFTANTFTVLSGSTLTIASGATIANSGTATGFGGADPSSADGDSLGTASAEWSDLYLADGGVIYFGNDQDVTLTHVADTGILLNSTMAIQFNDASQYINAPSATVLDINATDEIELNATAVDLNGTLDVSGATTAAAITASGIIKTDDTTAATSTTDGSLQTDGGLSVAADAVIGDDLKLLSDAAVLSFGANSEVSLTHVHDTGLLLNSTMALQFNDASQYINAPSATVLDINATDEIELNATLADVNANLDVSGTYTGGGLMTTGGNIVIPNAGNIGSASDTDAIAIASDGVVTMNQIPVFSAGINVSGGTIAGTLATAAQGNVTSLGTLTTLTVDNIIVNGTNIGHTSDTDAIAIGSDGVVTMNQIPVFSAGLTVSGGTLTIASEGGGNTTNATQGVAKAWINYKQASSFVVNDSFNVGSVDDDGTGAGTTNYSTAFNNTDYSANGGSARQSSTSDSAYWTFPTSDSSANIEYSTSATSWQSGYSSGTSSAMTKFDCFLNMVTVHGDLA